MAKNAIELITADHREVERMLEQLQSGTGGDRSLLLEEVGHLLVAHSRAEEEHVYPAVAQQAPEEKDQVRHSEEEHEEVEQLVHRLQSTDPGSDEFDTLVERLVVSVHDHVETEESEVLPALREAVGKKELEELGARFSRHRTEELERLESGVGREGGGGGERSREELYREAQQADIPGRSRMKKEELAEALEEQRQQEDEK